MSPSLEIQPASSKTTASQDCEESGFHAMEYGDKLPVVDHVLHLVTSPWPEWVWRGGECFPRENRKSAPTNHEKWPRR